MKAAEIRLYQGVKINRNNVTNLSSANLLTALSTHLVKTYTGLNIVLETYTLRVESNMYDIINCNYMAFLNSGYTQKWFFAYIESISYVSDAVSEITFRIDNWSTWFDNLIFLKCMVEREIVADDTIGLNTLDEGLDVGRIETLLTTSEVIHTALTDFWIVMQCDYDLFDEKQFEGQLVVRNSNFTGHSLKLFQINSSSDHALSDSIKYIKLYILGCNVAGHPDDIKSMFIVPYSLVPQTSIEQKVALVQGYPCTYYRFTTDSLGADSSNINISKVTSFSDYTPVNNKVFCYPYNYLYVTNNNGNQNIFKYEDFDNASNCEFVKESVFSQGCNIRIYPINYRHKNADYDEQLPCAKFPVCGWTSDSYINWLTQNGVNITSTVLGLLTDGLGVVNGIGNANESGNFDGYSSLKSGMNLFTNIMSFYDKFRLAKLMPNIEGGSQNNGDVAFAGGSISFDFCSRRCILENLIEIDDYFTRYGYRVNKMKTPNLSQTTLNHYFVKIMAGEKCLGGNVPTEVIDELQRQMYAGLTVWKALDNIGNYETGTII